MPGCGEPLAPNAAFCRSCGAKYEAPAPPEPDVQEQKTEMQDEEPTATAPTEPSCGKCGATLAAQQYLLPYLRDPSTCGWGTHREARCGGSSDFIFRLGARTAAASFPAAIEPSPTAACHTGAARWLGSLTEQDPIVIGALILLLGAGVAVAIVASKSSTRATRPPFSNELGPKAPMTEDRRRNGRNEEEEAVEEEPVETEGEVSSAGFPEVSRSQMDEEITSLLESYHEDVVEEDFQGAWAMLTPRKRRQYLREYGYPKWASAQASLLPLPQPIRTRSRRGFPRKRWGCTGRRRWYGLEQVRRAVFGMVRADLGQVRRR